jgi:hypothetical protein
MENKPIILEIEEAKEELIKCINDILSKHGLNCYLIEPTFSDLYAQVKASAQNELAQAKALMEQQRAVEEAQSETEQND